jgi:hypothetical protein
MRRILAALEHCPDLLGSLRPDRSFFKNDDDFFLYWKYFAVPWLRSCRGEELPGQLNILPAPHFVSGNVTTEEQ